MSSNYHVSSWRHFSFYFLVFLSHCGALEPSHDSWFHRRKRHKNHKLNWLGTPMKKKSVIFIWLPTYREISITFEIGMSRFSFDSDTNQRCFSPFKQWLKLSAKFSISKSPNTFWQAPTPSPYYFNKIKCCRCTFKDALGIGSLLRYWIWGTYL